jgi:hypothetical protein
MRFTDGTKYESVILEPRDVLCYSGSVIHSSSGHTGKTPVKNLYYVFNKASDGDLYNKYFDGEDSEPAFSPIIH